MARAGAGYLHPGCAPEHTGEEDLMALLRANSKGLSEADVNELAAAIAG